MALRGNRWRSGSAGQKFSMRRMEWWWLWGRRYSALMLVLGSWYIGKQRLERCARRIQSNTWWQHWRRWRSKWMQTDTQTKKKTKIRETNQTMIENSKFKCQWNFIWRTQRRERERDNKMESIESINDIWSDRWTDMNYYGQLNTRGTEVIIKIEWKTKQKEIKLWTEERTRRRKLQIKLDFLVNNKKNVSRKRE